MDAVIYNKIEQEANRIINAYVGNITPGAKVGLYTPTEDLNTVTIAHDFGTVPKTALIIGVPNTSAWADVPQSMILYAALGSSPENGDYDNSYATSQKIDALTQYSGALSYNTSSTYTTYPASMTTTSVTFATGRYYNGKFKAGVTYIYVIIK